MTGREGSVALEVSHDDDGRSWVAVDSVVDLLADIARNADPGPVQNSMRGLADAFRPMSSYATMTATTQDDGSTMLARRCSCGTVVIDGRRITGDPITVNAEPEPDGGFFPLKIRDGVPTISQWQPHLDGAIVIRLAEHTCGTGP